MTNFFTFFNKDKFFRFFHNFWIFILSTLGLAFLFWFFNQKFLTLRLPKVVPFELTEIGFYFILYIIFIYLYIIYNFIKKKKEINPYLKKIIDVIFLPLTTLDRTIKRVINKIFIKKIKKNKNRIVLLLKDDINSEKKLLVFNLFINLLPRIILVSFFVTDVFYFNKIENFYKIIIIGIIPLINRYLKFSLKKIKEEIINYLEKKFTGVFFYDEKYYDSEKSKYDQFENPSNQFFENIKDYKIIEFLDIKEKIRIYNLEEEKKLFKGYSEDIIQNAKIEGFINEEEEILLRKGYTEEMLIDLRKGYYTKKEIEEEIERKNKEEIIEYSYYPMVYPKVIEDYRKKFYDEKDEVLDKKSYNDLTYNEEKIYQSIKNHFRFKFKERIELINIYQALYFRYKDIEERKIIKWTRIFIYFLFLFSWLYILIKSYPSIKDFDFTKGIIEIMIKKIKIPEEIN